MLKSHYLVAGDIYRPAAVDQLVTLGNNWMYLFMKKEHVKVLKIL